jgi:hypothetical protein
MPTGPATLTSFQCPDSIETVAYGANNHQQFVGTCLSMGTLPGTQQKGGLNQGFIYDADSNALNVFEYPGSDRTEPGIRARGSSSAQAPKQEPPRW